MISKFNDYITENVDESVLEQIGKILFDDIFKNEIKPHFDLQFGRYFINYSQPDFDDIYGFEINFYTEYDNIMLSVLDKQKKFQKLRELGELYILNNTVEDKEDYNLVISLHFSNDVKSLSKLLDVYPDLAYLLIETDIPMPESVRKNHSAFDAEQLGLI